MATHLLKISPGQDCYVLWSTSEAGPEWIGPRAEIEAELRRRGEYREDRFTRADRHGSSARAEAGPSPVVPYGWSHNLIPVGEGLPDGAGLRWLPRANLEAYTRAAVDERADDMLALTVPDDEGEI